jgi:hypothetical protein
LLSAIGESIMYPARIACATLSKISMPIFSLLRLGDVFQEQRYAALKIKSTNDSFHKQNGSARPVT